MNRIKKFLLYLYKYLYETFHSTLLSQFTPLHSYTTLLSYAFVWYVTLKSSARETGGGREIGAKSPEIVGFKTSAGALGKQHHGQHKEGAPAHLAY